MLCHRLFDSFAPRMRPFDQTICNHGVPISQGTPLSVPIIPAIATDLLPSMKNIYAPRTRQPRPTSSTLCRQASGSHTVAATASHHSDNGMGSTKPGFQGFYEYRRRSDFRTSARSVSELAVLIS